MHHIITAPDGLFASFAWGKIGSRYVETETRRIVAIGTDLETLYVADGYGIETVDSINDERNDGNHFGGLEVWAAGEQRLHDLCTADIVESRLRGQIGDLLSAHQKNWGIS